MLSKDHVILMIAREKLKIIGTQVAVVLPPLPGYCCSMSQIDASIDLECKEPCEEHRYQAQLISSGSIISVDNKCI